MYRIWSGSDWNVMKEVTFPEAPEGFDYMIDAVARAAVDAGEMINSVGCIPGDTDKYVAEYGWNYRDCEGCYVIQILKITEDEHRFNYYWYFIGKKKPSWMD